MTHDELRALLARNPALSTGDPRQDPKLERAAGHGPLAAREAQEGNASRVHVRFMTLTKRAALVLQQIDAAIALAEKAMQGPWEVEETEDGIETTACGPVKVRYRRDDNGAMLRGAQDNAEFIATSRTLLPASLRCLKTAIERLALFCGHDTWAADIVATLCDQWEAGQP